MDKKAIEESFSKEMNRRIIEKVASILLMVWGIVALYYAIIKINYTYAFYLKAEYEFGEISIFKIIRNFYFPVVIPVVTIVFSILLLLSKRIGWIGSIITSFVNGLGLMILLWKSIKDLENGNDGEYSLEYFIFTSIVIILLVVGGVLLNKMFRQKYSPTLKEWIGIVIIIVLLLIDRIII